MHTLKVIFGGFLLLGLCLLLGHWIGGAAATVVATAIKYFLVLWLVATLVNMWVGVSKAGYSMKDEAPVALLVFAVPAIVAIVIWWRFSASSAEELFLSTSRRLLRSEAFAIRGDRLDSRVGGGALARWPPSATQTA